MDTSADDSGTSSAADSKRTTDAESRASFVATDLVGCCVKRDFFRSRVCSGSHYFSSLQPDSGTTLSGSASTNASVHSSGARLESSDSKRSSTSSGGGSNGSSQVLPTSIEQLKVKGNAAFTAHDYNLALALYTKAIDSSPAGCVTATELAPFALTSIAPCCQL